LEEIAIEMAGVSPIHRVMSLMPEMMGTLVRGEDLKGGTLSRRSDPTLLSPMSSLDEIFDAPSVEKTHITTPFGEMHMITISGSYSMDSKIF